MASTIYIASHDCVGANHTELSFRAGERVEITFNEAEWWYGRKDNGVEGWVPPAFLDTKNPVVDAEDAEETFKDENSSSLAPSFNLAENRYGDPFNGALSEDLTPEEKRTMRQSVLSEIVDKEQTFVDNLQTFSDAIYEPLCVRDDAFKRSFLSNPSLGLCISMLAEQMKSICSNFLHSLVEVRKSGNYTLLADAYGQFAPSMHLFGQYISENSNALSALNSFGKPLEEFLNAHPFPNGITIERVFLLPIEHYSTYYPDFKKFVLLTPTSDECHGMLTEALELLENYSAEVDAKLKVEEERMKLLAIQSKFIGNPPIYKPNRIFIKEGKVERIGEGKRPKVYHLHLFNDALLISSYNGVFDSFKFHKVVDMDNASVAPEVVFEVITGFTITTSESKRYTFRCGSSSDAEGWMATISQCMQDLKVEKAKAMVKTDDLGIGKKSKYTKRASIVKGMSGTAAPVVVSTLDEALDKAPVGSMGPRAQSVYKFLMQENDALKQFQKLNTYVLQPLIAASKGAPLQIGTSSKSDGTPESNSLFQQSNSALSVIGGTFSKIQSQNQTELLRQSGVQIFLRAAEALCSGLEQMLSDIEIRVSSVNWGESFLIGDIFTALAARALLQQHEAYASGELETIRVLKNNTFDAFKREALAILFPFTFETLISGPVNGPERYLSMCSAALSLAPADIADRASLTESIELLQKSVAQVNDVVKEKKNFEKLIEIHSSFVSIMFPDPVLTNLVTSKRTFVQEGDMLKVCRKKNKKFHFYLFNDYLAYSSSVGPNTYSWHRALDLSKCKIRKLDGSTFQHAFEILGEEKSFVVITESNEELEQWTSAIQSQMDALGNFADSESSTTAAPIWIPDNIGNNGCSVCQCEFTMFRRRHHCRKCGALVCGDHSKSSMMVPNVDKKNKVRVCDNCFNGTSKSETTPEVAASPAPPPNRRMSSMNFFNLSSRNLGASSTPSPAPLVSTPSKAHIDAAVDKDEDDEKPVVASPPPASRALPPPPPLLSKQPSGLGADAPRPPPPRISEASSPIATEQAVRAAPPPPPPPKAGQPPPPPKRPDSDSAPAPPPPPQNKSQLLGLLANAMTDRRVAFNNDDGSGSDNSDDEFSDDD